MWEWLDRLQWCHARCARSLRCANTRWFGRYCCLGGGDRCRARTGGLLRRVCLAPELGAYQAGPNWSPSVSTRCGLMVCVVACYRRIPGGTPVRPRNQLRQPARLTGAPRAESGGRPSQHVLLLVRANKCECCTSPIDVRVVLMQPRHTQDDIVSLELSGGEVESIRIGADTYARTFVHASRWLRCTVGHRDRVECAPT